MSIQGNSNSGKRKDGQSAFARMTNRIFQDPVCAGARKERLIILSISEQYVTHTHTHTSTVSSHKVNKTLSLLLALEQDLSSLSAFSLEASGENSSTISSDLSQKYYPSLYTCFCPSLLVFLPIGLFGFHFPNINRAGQSLSYFGLSSIAAVCSTERQREERRG